MARPAGPYGLAPEPVGDGRADGSDTGRDEREPVDAFGVAAQMSRCRIGSGAVREKVHAVQAEGSTQGFHIVDEPVTAAGGEVRRHGGP